MGLYLDCTLALVPYREFQVGLYLGSALAFQKLHFVLLSHYVVDLLKCASVRNVVLL